MNFYSESSIFNYPVHPPEYTQGIHEVEETAAKALRNIHLIYSEIMSPKEYHSEESVIVYNNLNENATYISDQNHYVKSCCSTLKELCVKCDSYIARCSSCNRCNCNLSNRKIAKARNDGTSKDTHCLYKCTSAQNHANFKVKCTVPEPFSLYVKNTERQKAKEHKILKMKQELDNKIEKELKIRANCKPVPKSTHLPLYNQMIQEKEKHKAERKEKCLVILNDAKPFNLHSLKRSARAKSSSDLVSANAYNFKAKPVPTRILSSKVSEKLQNKEEVRKMLISERAKQMKEQSSLPFSQKSVVQSYSMIDLHNFQKPPSKEQSKPKNISEITKRLYIKKCNETMNSWNKKVLLVDADKKIANLEKQNLLLSGQLSLPKNQLTKCQELPFMYFPVRMSNAAILREKQIRAEILARKEREERRKQDAEFAKKKTNTDILHKLRNLIPASVGEKEIDEKVKSFRESQSRRKQEYEKELEEIMKRVSEQNLLLERQSKVMRESSPVASESVQKTSESDENELQKSIASDSGTDNSSSES